MNFLLRSTICRTPSIFSFNRQLSSRRALRSILPKQQNRSTNSKPFGFINENNVVVGIIAANGIVYAAWKIAHAKFINNHDQTLLVWMTKHFSENSFSIKFSRIKMNRRFLFNYNFSSFQWCLGTMSFDKIVFGLYSHLLSVTSICHIF